MKLMYAITLAMLLSGCDQVASVQSPATAVESAKNVSTTIADKPWNIEDVDATTNGNMAIAAAKLLRGDEFEKGNADAAEVVKAPWKFYGKMMCFLATVAQAEDYPPGAEGVAEMGGSLAEIVALSDSDQVLDMLLIGGSGNIQSGQAHRMCGLVAGRTEVENRIGGTFQHLMMVGKLEQQ